MFSKIFSKANKMDFSTRAASHAGSWYSDSKEELDAELSKYLDDAEKKSPDGLLKGIIAPHAGFAFSGPTAGWAYKNIDPTKYKRVFLLGPSHKVYLDGCALTECESFDTPLGSITIDREITEILKDQKGFEYFTKSQDEDEHSLEMHLPFIKKVFGDADITLVPVVVGSVSLKKER